MPPSEWRSVGRREERLPSTSGLSSYIKAVGEHSRRTRFVGPCALDSGEPAATILGQSREAAACVMADARLNGSGRYATRLVVRHRKPRRRSQHRKGLFVGGWVVAGAVKRRPDSAFRLGAPELLGKPKVDCRLRQVQLSRCR